MNQAIDYDKLANMLAERVQKTPRNAKAIWVIKDAAGYLKISDRDFRDRVSKHTSFPTPISLPTAQGHRCNRRWYAEDIIKWASRHKG